LLSAQPVYSQYIVGYWNSVFVSGDNLFVVPLQVNTNNLLSGIFWGNGIPEGASVSLWNPSTASFDATSVYQSGAWTVDLLLLPGIGARLTTSSAFTNTFVGYVRNHDGTGLTNDNLTLPPIFASPAGIYLFGDAAPFVSSGTDVFLNIFGRLPNAGEQVTLLDALTQTYTTSTYLGNNSWDVVPTLNISQAGFFNISAVPEPSSMALGLLGVALLGVFGRRRY
jgi:hypothetical protein